MRGMTPKAAAARQRRKAYLAKPTAIRKCFTLNGTDEWRAWVKRLMKKERMCLSDLVHYALWELADQCGYDEPPPRTAKPPEDVRR